jgi:hypothetical protein
MGVMLNRRNELLTRHRSRQSVIESVQVTEENAAAVARMVNGKVYLGGTGPLAIYFHCCNGRAKAGWGDWIIHTPKGFAVMTNAEFTTQYEGAEQ